MYKSDFIHVLCLDPNIILEQLKTTGFQGLSGEHGSGKQGTTSV